MSFEDQALDMIIRLTDDQLRKLALMVHEERLHRARKKADDAERSRK